MKYWVYKESRILGPFDKEAVSSLQGLDSGTLVCAGDPAGGEWVPAGEHDGLTGIAAGGIGEMPRDDFPSSVGLLDQLQIDSAGLIDDHEFPGSFAEELFQDSTFKKGFQDILSAGIASEELEARSAREKISDLTSQIEAMSRHISELEAGQTDLARLLAAKDLELRSGGSAAGGTTSVQTLQWPQPPPLSGEPPPVAVVPEAAFAPSDRPEASSAGAEDFPSFPGATLVLPSAEPPALPPVEPPAAPKWFGKPKSFKIVPAFRSFKVIGADETVPAPSLNPAPEFRVEPIIAMEAPIPTAPPAAAAAPPIPAAVSIVPAPVVLAPVPVPAPIPVIAAVPMPEPAPITNPFTLPVRLEPAIPTPFSVPPNTLSRTQPVPDLTSGDLLGLPPTGSGGGASSPSGSADAAGGAASGELAARFAKPELAPPTGEIKTAGRSNKAFLIGGGVLVTLLLIMGVILMRQPKDDLKQMTTLDDGKAPIGLPADDNAALPPPIVKPKIAEAPPAPPPGPSAEHAAAITLVKDFPLDGGRGTVGRWLQYSYTADPNAGSEEWSASATGDNTVLVEYRLIPRTSGGKGALYLFEMDTNGLVMGKNIEARQMLAGGPPPEAPKAKKPAKKAPKRASKRRAISETPKEVPLLPLPDSGELRPPAEDDGSFGSDTINSGI